MNRTMLWSITMLAISTGGMHAQTDADSSPHRVMFVSVEKDVKLEVLDWGGTGRPLVFLAGMGNTAHNFDSFAPLFISDHHVYGITRRGFGASSKPAPANGNYSTDRLGDDVVAVIDTLKLNRPVLAGHSFAGAEMSSVGSRHPEKVAGLIYLDAAYGFAFYDRAHPFMEADMNDLRQRLDKLHAGGLQDEKQFLKDTESSVAELEKSLRASNQGVASMPTLPPRTPIIAALTYEQEKYTEIPVPVLAVFACPHNWDRVFRADSPVKAERMAADHVSCSAQASAFAAGVPTAHVVRLANADHYVFISNQAELVREMNAFLSKLPDQRR
jgi:non-heme chloroperoxidase